MFAHPDDETFCVGGIVAKYAARGIRVDLYCATDGDAGKVAGVPVSSRQELGALRRNECRTATAAFFLSGLTSAYPEQGLEPFAARRIFYHAWEFPLPDPTLVIKSVPPTVAIDVREWRPQKDAAFKAHATQQGSAAAFYSSALKDVEHLALAAGVPQPRTPADDPFEGL